MTDLTAKLATIGLKLPEEALRSLVQHAEKKKLSHSQLLEHLVEIETRERDARNLQRRARAATLGAFKTIDQFDWNHPRSIERDLYESLYESLQFIPRGENVLLRGVGRLAPPRIHSRHRAAPQTLHPTRSAHP